MEASEITALVERYVALWNEPDAMRRQEGIRALWPQDGSHYTRNIAAIGWDAIEARVANAHARFVGTGLHRFQSAFQSDEHNQVVRLHWRMMPVGGGPAAAGGIDFLMLDNDGRIRTDYQFNDPSL